MHILLRLSLIISVLIPTITMALDPAPWESVEVIPRPSATYSKSNHQVTVISNKITKVIVYTESFCDDCKKTIEFMKLNAVKYEEQEFGVLTGAISSLFLNQSAPLTKIYYTNGESKQIYGFDRDIMNSIFSSNSQQHYPNKTSDFDLNINNDSFEINQ